MPYSQKYCLVWFINPVKIGDEFEMTDWPIHVTVADVFAIDRRGNDIDTKLAELLAKQPPVTTHATEEATLGTTPVVLAERNDNLLALHTRIVDLLASNHAEFNTPKFTREGFLPHCTTQKVGRLNSGDELKIDTVTLVDMFPNDDWQQRKVLRTFKLQGKQF